MTQLDLMTSGPKERQCGDCRHWQPFQTTRMLGFCNSADQKASCTDRQESCEHFQSARAP